VAAPSFSVTRPSQTENMSSSKPITRSTGPKSPVKASSSALQPGIPAPGLAAPPAISVPAPNTQKQMSKAERRELQEAQRAAKAQGGAPSKGSKQPQSSGGDKMQPKGASSSGSPSVTAARMEPSSSANSGQPRGQLPARTMHPINSRDTDRLSQEGTPRGSRIFSHFGVPKQSSSHIKGDIHPAVVSLSNKYGSFSITGADARCLSLMAVLKLVRVPLILKGEGFGGLT
jgi:translation initiation factor eIF-2B subunit delta